jgi:hypothetical protein
MFLYSMVAFNYSIELFVVVHNVPGLKGGYMDGEKIRQVGKVNTTIIYTN